MSEGMASVADATPDEAFQELLRNSAARLIDVRTKAELNYVGFPLPPDRDLIAIEWQVYPTMQVAADFGDRLAAAVPDKSAPLFFLCRSGARSLAAARLAASLGYETCVNVTDGFEGPPDGDGHRGNVAGWKASGLPWRQG